MNALLNVLVTEWQKHSIISASERTREKHKAEVAKLREELGRHAGCSNEVM
jgi:hypothetical protein